MRIQHNIAAMNAYRNYNTNTSAVSKNLEKLSSGYKINRAGDDAAGLAISEKMRAQISGLEAASKNVKDGISLVKTAEGAMQEVQDMLNRMVTLATQSANGTYDNEVDRLNLQKEVDQLRSEINRIADSSNFNGIKLLDGTQEIKTSYALSSPEMSADSKQVSADGVFQIVSDGQLGVDAQAGVFTYDLSQLKFKIPEDTEDAADAPAGNADARSVSDYQEATPETATASVDSTAMPSSFKLTDPGTDTVTASEFNGGKAFSVTIEGQKFEVTVADDDSGDVKAEDSDTVNALLGKIKSALDDKITAHNATEAAKNADYTALNLTDLKIDSGAIAAEATKTAMTYAPGNDDDDGEEPEFSVTNPTDPKTTVKDGDTNTAATVEVDLAGMKATGNGSVAITVGGKEYTIEAEDGDDAKKLADKLAAAINKDPITSTETGDFTATVDANGKVTLTAANKAALPSELKTALEKDITTEAKPETPDSDSGSTAEVTLNLGGFDITLNLKKGVEYSGADLAKEIASALNNPVQAKDDGGDGNDGGNGDDSQIQALAADDANGGNGTPWTGKLAGAAVTASFNGSTLTITMDEAPTEKWNVDMTLKFNSGAGNGGEQFKPTVEVEPIDDTQNRQYAQATINMNKVDMKDGFSLQLGNTTYTFAIGSDSRFKNAANVVDLTDLTQKQFQVDDTATDDEKAAQQAAKDKAIATAINRLSKAAAANTTFYVGSDTKGMISLTEKEGAVDYAVNNLAGNDGVGTAGRGTGKLDADDLTKVDGDHTAKADTANDLPAADATIADWKGLVKLGQASTTGNGLTLQIGDTSESYNQLTVSIGDIHTKALGINNIDISTQSGAQKAIDTIKTAINSVSSIRGTLGATQNRLEHTANNLSVMTENIQDAESTIRDTDIAEEMMAYTKNNILVQSAQAMLAQANQIPQGVLQLLG